MKEIYTKPMAEVEEFASVEVLTASSTGGAEVLPGEWD